MLTRHPATLRSQLAGRLLPGRARWPKAARPDDAADGMVDWRRSDPPFLSTDRMAIFDALPLSAAVPDPHRLHGAHFPFNASAGHRRRVVT